MSCAANKDSRHWAAFPAKATEGPRCMRAEMGGADHSWHSERCRKKNV